jgi:hypothetical protein
MEERTRELSKCPPVVVQERKEREPPVAAWGTTTRFFFPFLFFSVVFARPLRL